MKLTRILSELGAAFNALRKHWGFALLSILTDFLFLLLFFQTHYTFFTRASGAVLTLMQGLQEQASSLGEGVGDINTALLATPERQAAWASLLQNIGLFLIITLALWIVCKGIAWYAAHRMAGSKIVPARFAAAFTLSTLVGFAGAIVILLLGGFLLDSATTSPLPLVGEGLARATIFLFLAALTYKMWAAYAHGDMHRMLPAIRSAFSIRQPFIIAAIIAAILGASAILNTAAIVQMSREGGLAFLIFIGLPLLTFGRVLMVRARPLSAHRN